MSPPLLLVMVLGALAGASLVLLCTQLPPAHVELHDAFDRMTPARHRKLADLQTPADAGRKERLGVWAMRALPPAVWVRTPARELALLRIPLARFYGEKLQFAALGLLIPPLMSTFFALLGLDLPFAMPAVAAPALAAVMFFIPNYNALDGAKKARGEFRRAMAAYIDLVATERHNGAATRQAMESAAEVSHNWVFRRIAEELRRSGFSGVPPWDALHALADELTLPELADFADIMRLSGAEGAAVYANLRARSAALRTAMLSDELAVANALGERMTIPGSLVGVIFMALLLAPALLGMFTGT
ncbi:type II secretion system F family protein [Georgenia satyanarayanai]|uniref:type II secretion system F family protein n=1 Tax=Georgenia satyanarayanai TaxID=860221 RepID=UPI001264D37C|nr:type II secretion system F family protein [Georgenia satyanarayanai]